MVPWTASPSDTASPWIREDHTHPDLNYLFMQWDVMDKTKNIRTLLDQLRRAVQMNAAPRAAGWVLSLCAVLVPCVTLVPTAHGFGVPENAAANPYVGNAEAAQKGEELFGRICQQCHNTRGHGGKCPQLVRGAWGPGGANSDTYMFDTISNGRPNTQMAAFGQALSADEIWQIVSFLRAEAVRVKASEAGKDNDEGADLWQ